MKVLDRLAFPSVQKRQDKTISCVVRKLSSTMTSLLFTSNATSSCILPAKLGVQMLKMHVLTNARRRSCMLRSTALFRLRRRIVSERFNCMSKLHCECTHTSRDTPARKHVGHVQVR